LSVHPPLLVFFHGHGGNARAAAQRIHFRDEWPEAIVVYPQGLPTASPIDPGGRLPGWQRQAGENADRDLRLQKVALDFSDECLPFRSASSDHSLTQLIRTHVIR